MPVSDSTTTRHPASAAGGARGAEVDELPWAAMADWAVRWGVPGLPQRVVIGFSRRMTRALGRYRPSRSSIHLNVRLRDGASELLLEVLCHELAHAAVVELHGARVRPHGREWAELMRQAGFDARARLPHASLPLGLIAAPRRLPAIWEHRCPVCQVARSARRPVRAWRCARCLAQGRAGLLLIRRREPRAQ